MASRAKLHKELEDILGSKYVYFQPPESIKMTYPAIVYKLSAINAKSADDINYLLPRKYSVTVITKDPDTPIVDQMLKLQTCKFDRSFKSDQLNHFVFNLFY